MKTTKYKAIISTSPLMFPKVRTFKSKGDAEEWVIRQRDKSGVNPFAFKSGSSSGKSNTMQIIDKGNKTLLVGYGWAVYGMRDKTTGKITFFKGWDGYSPTTSKQLSQTGLRGADIVIDRKPELRDFE